MQDLTIENAAVEENRTLTQIKTGYQTAIAVQRPRDIDAIVKAVEREAVYGGDSFYYSWPVKNKQTGRKQLVEGPSWGAMACLAREWTNCAVEVEVVEENNSYQFTAVWVDLEKGFSIPRIFRQSKTSAPGKYDKDRWNDMQFQIGQSKALRNAIKAGLPSWLTDRVVSLAKKAAIEGITKTGIAEASTKAVFFLSGKGVGEEQIVSVIGKPVNEWTSEDVAQLRGMCTQIHDGAARVEELFPPVVVDVVDEMDEKFKTRPKPKEKGQKDSETGWDVSFLLKELEKITTKAGLLKFEKAFSGQIDGLSEKDKSVYSSASADKMTVILDEEKSE